MRSRSPIEMMVDEACGFDRANYTPPPQITLRCLRCKRTKSAPIDPTDPPGTAIIESLCDKCDDGGGFPETLYFDKDGRWFNGEAFVHAKPNED